VTVIGEVCEFIRHYTAKNGFPPTPARLCAHVHGKLGRPIEIVSIETALETAGLVVIQHEPAVGVMLTEAGAAAAEGYRASQRA